jgi:hypothetical protein
VLVGLKATRWGFVTRTARLFAVRKVKGRNGYSVSATSKDFVFIGSILSGTTGKGSARG